MCADMDRSKAVDLAITQLNGSSAKGSIMKLGSHDRVADVPAISTGSLSLDIALGTFGVPRGRVVEIYGPESGGKPHWHCTSLPKRKRKTASRLTLTRSTPWT